MTAATQEKVTPWRLFEVSVARVQPLSSSFVRVTFTGEDLREFGDDGYDQRIKVILPAPDGSLVVGQDEGGLSWFAELRERPDHLRNPVRTYTSRYVRADEAEVDVDFVLHGDEGPASRWAGSVAVGDRIVICGPNAAHPAPYGGTGFDPAPQTRRFLLVADETAVPAALSIAERLPVDAVGAVLLEVPHADDVLEVSAPDGVEVRWLARDGAPVGEFLGPAVTELVDSWVEGPPGASSGGEAGAVEDGILWDVPEEAVAGPFYAWLAGEASVITGLRRHMVKERGVDRRSVAFMGYWRRGRAEN